MTTTRQSILMILLAACTVPLVLRAEASPRPDTCEVIRITPQTAWIEAHPAPPDSVSPSLPLTQAAIWPAPANAQPTRISFTGENSGRGNSLSVGVNGLEVIFSSISRRTRAPRALAPHPGKYRGYLGLLEFGFNGLAAPRYAGYPDAEQGFLDLNNAQSIHVAWNILRMSTAFNRTHTLGFTTCLGLVWDNIAFSDNLTVVRHEGMIRPVPIKANFKKSKITTFSFTLPLIFEASFHKFFVSAGAYGGIVLGAHTKYKKPKHKDKHNPYVNMLQAGLTARIGYRCLYAFGNYALTPFFKNTKGPETRMFTVGFGFRL